MLSENKIVRRNIWMVVVSLSKNEGTTMTNLTEVMFGSSGRGSPKAKSLIRACETLSFVRIEKSGRSELVYLTDRGRSLVPTLIEEFGEI